MSDPNEIVMYIIVRADLGMSKGKIAAQAGHAVQLAMRATEKAAGSEARVGFDDAERLAAWEAGSYPKIALHAESAEQLEQISGLLSNAGVVIARVVDEGRTEIPAGTLTALGVQPMPRVLMKPILGNLKLLA